MKKFTTVFLSLVLCLALILSLTACGDKKEKESSTAVTPVTIPNVSEGETLNFGHYEQDNNRSNGKEPIEWIVLEKRADGSLVLLSKYALDCKKYNSKNTDVTWETCTLRKWLNEDFYNAAFSVAEQAKIVTVTLEIEDYPDYDAKGGKVTQDKVWLLSINEVTDKYGKEKVYNRFSDDKSKMCTPTRYAVAQGANQVDYSAVDGVGTCGWWLRSPGLESNFAAFINEFGSIYSVGEFVYIDNISVRPAIVVQP